MFLKKKALAGTHTAGANHYRVRLANGMIIPQSISASNDGPAEVTYAVIGYSTDGSTSPLSITGSTALPTTPAYDSAHTVGPVKINGSTYTGITKIDINFGIQEILMAADGEVYDTWISLQERTMTVSVTSIDAGLFNTLGIIGAAQGATDSLVYLRSCTIDGTRDADISATHLKASIDQGYIRPDSLSVSQGNPYEFSFVIECTYDGTNLPIALSVAAIT